MLLLTAITLLQLASSGTRAQTNSAPELSTPTSTSLYLVFPKAAGAALEFPGEPATDADADPISYHMTFQGPLASRTRPSENSWSSPRTASSSISVPRAG